ncbi:hypothetical protein BDZ97DRAFT_2030592 [Flammula alnicola]|nr:hypothetical protein BDZ97DRAFT_2030592 [Flammula alnicola]
MTERTFVNSRLHHGARSLVLFLKIRYYLLVLVARRTVALKASKRTPEPKDESEESSSSEDEYVEDKAGHPEQEQTTDKRHGRLRRLSTVSASDTVAEAGKRRLSRGNISTSPSPSAQGRLKQKARNVARSSSPPPPKKKRSGDSHEHTATDDPVRTESQ